LQLLGYPRLERHVRIDITLEIDPRRDLDEFKAAIDDAEDGALRHEECRPALSLGKLGVVADLLDAADELPVTSLLGNGERAIAGLQFETARGEGSAEHHVLGVLADVDETAHADDLGAEAADVDTASRIDFRERKEGDVEAAAVVEVELVRLIDDRIVVLRS